MENINLRFRQCAGTNKFCNGNCESCKRKDIKLEYDNDFRCDSDNKEFIESFREFRDKIKR